MKDPNGRPQGQGARRIKAVVALRLLEVIKDQDLPGEILEDEDPTRTMPRRFGLSDVVERQIRAYKADARKRVRLTDEEVGGLFRFVIRRPDGDQIFEQVGRLLAGPRRLAPWTRALPKRARFALARSATRKRLKQLFGRAVGGFGRGPFVIEGRSLFFIGNDPGGDACHLLTGFCSEIVEQYLRGTARVDHTLCQSRGDELCRWEATFVEEPATRMDRTDAQQVEPDVQAPTESGDVEDDGREGE